MTDNISTIEGIPGSDAAATNRGFLYQDLATALAWVRLTDEQTLVVEAAEDMAVARERSADVHQIRDVARPLTLKGALPFLENALQNRERNPRRSLRFIYATTASIGRDKAKRHQVEDLVPKRRRFSLSRASTSMICICPRNMVRYKSWTRQARKPTMPC